MSWFANTHSVNDTVKTLETEWSAGIKSISNTTLLHQNGYPTISLVLSLNSCRTYYLFFSYLKVAHVHVRNPSDIPLVRRTLEGTPGVERVMDSTDLDAYYREKGCCGGGSGGGARRAVDARAAHNAERSGELVAVADSSSWFAYYYWTDDSMAPDFASCVAIHRKPGYDPAEMFFRFPGFWGFAWLIFKLLLSYGLKLRTNVDATPLRCDAIRGSHGRLPEGDNDPRPVLVFRRRAGSRTAGDEGELGTSTGDDGGGAVSVGGAKDLGIEGCIKGAGNIVAEDVYEVLWRILAGEIL